MTNTFTFSLSDLKVIDDLNKSLGESRLRERKEAEFDTVSLRNGSRIENFFFKIGK